MKKVSIVLAAIMLCGLVPYGTSQAAMVEANVASVVGLDVYGPSPDDFAGTPPPGEIPDNATALSPVPASWPQPLPGSNLEGAMWITTETQNATQTTYRLFQDSFMPAATATKLVGSLYTAANNSQVVYFNGDSLSPLGSDLSTPRVETFEFFPEQGEANTCNDNIFGFDVQTGPAGEPLTNPAGLIYRAVITYELPDVIWRPPIVGTGRTILKNGSTLPIKFRLRNASGVIRTRQNIYLSITGPGLSDVRFNLGRGSRNLRFARGNGQYIANFHSKRYDLVTGAVYMVNVNDGCTDEVLGSIPMKISGKGGQKHGNGKGHGNGNGHGHGNGKK